MLKLKKKESIETLRENVERKTLQLEHKLLESQWAWLDNIIDPRGAYIDDVSGEQWDSIGRYGITQENVEPFNTPEEHSFIRQRCRKASRNPYAQNLLKNLVAFIVGKGHNYNVRGKRGYHEKVSKPYCLKLQAFIDHLLKINKWKSRQKEIRKRWDRDGEVFIRIFPQSDGYARFRFVEPQEVKTPPEWSADKSASYGIKTDPDDVETPEIYFVGDEEVEAHEMQHRKANVDVNCKRGLSTLWCIGKNLDRGAQLLQNMSTLMQTRAAIAMIRKHDKSSSAVRSFASNTNTNPIQYTNPTTREVVKGKPLRPGSVIDTTKGTEYEFPSLNSSAADGVGVLSAELRAIASSNCLPEYMVGSDASNANYSSTMVAESPAVRFFESEQDDMIEDDLELIWAAVEYAIDANVLPQEVMECCEICVEAPALVTRDPLQKAQADAVYVDKRIKSPQTTRDELGLDSEQEDRNWTEFDDAHLEGGTLPMNPLAPDINGGGGPGYVPPAEDVVAAENPEAALLNMAGGITGYLEIMAKLKEGVIHREQAVAALMKFFRLERAEAEDMVGA